MENPTLLSDRPTSDGMANVLRRSAQLEKLRWTPVAPMPMTANIKSECNEREPFATFKAWRPQTGLPYSSVRLKEKFIGYNVSLETFVTALANPKSVLYTRNLTGQGLRMSCWYGIVCSAFVSYALGLPCRRTCRQWGKYGDMILTEVNSSREIRLCDILCSQKHAALVTGVTRHRDGSVHSVTVTECTRPLTVATEFSPEEFDCYWMKEFKVFRYAGIDGVRYTQSPYVHLEGDPVLIRPEPNRTLLPDYGNRANYHLGEQVELNIMQEYWTRLVVMNETGVVFEKQLEGTGAVAFIPHCCGYYRAFCFRDRERSELVEFAVVHLGIRSEEEPAPGRPLKLAFILPEEDRLVSCVVANASDGFTVVGAPFSEEAARRHRIELPPLPKGSYRIKALAENDYGLYAANPLCIEFKEGGGGQ